MGGESHLSTHQAAICPAHPLPETLPPSSPRWSSFVSCATHQDENNSSYASALKPTMNTPLTRNAGARSVPSAWCFPDGLIIVHILSNRLTGYPSQPKSPDSLSPSQGLHLVGT